MNDETRRTSEMATRMKGFATISEDAFPANSIGGQRFGTLNDLTAKIELYGSREAQERNAAKAATEAKANYLESIRRQKRAIRATAFSIEGQQPGISQNFNMPASLSAESTVEGARAFIATATPLKPLFLSREMPENFLEVLAETIQGYEDAVKDYNLHSANRAAAKSMLQDLCAQVRVLRRELDPIVRNKYRNDPEKLALWETASHLEKPPRKSAPAEPGNGNQPPTGGQS
jgi:hypothetical protein